jgi:hypothetical protein
LTRAYSFTIIDPCAAGFFSFPKGRRLALEKIVQSGTFAKIKWGILLSFVVGGTLFVYLALNTPLRWETAGSKAVPFPYTVVSACNRDNSPGLTFPDRSVKLEIQRAERGTDHQGKLHYRVLLLLSETTRFGLHQDVPIEGHVWKIVRWDNDGTQLGSYMAVASDSAPATASEDYATIPYRQYLVDLPSQLGNVETVSAAIETRTVRLPDPKDAIGSIFPGTTCTMTFTRISVTPNGV